MHIIENETLRVAIKSKGAELDSLYHKKHRIEYLWSGDPAFWGKKSPVLFPIVGTLKDNTYFFEGKTYHLSRHGFAREREFEVVDQGAEHLELRLQSDEETLKVYPFHFEFYLIYRLKEAQLSVTYRIVNLSTGTLFASVGAHPAFKVPLAEGLHYDDYYLEFSETETAGRYPINAEGLIKTPVEPLLQASNRLPLTKDLFRQDALVFKGLRSTQISLRSTSNPHGLTMTYAGFPFFGIWAAPKADFVCLEPWCGIADGADAGQDFAQKEGIESVEAGSVFERTWRVEVF